MKAFVLDITGRNASQYNPSLCEWVAKNMPSGEVTLLSTRLVGEAKLYKYKQLMTFVPASLTSSESKVKRLLRAVELVVNYTRVALCIGKEQPDILHIQWLPILEFGKGEKTFIRLFRLLDKKLKVILTVHNIYPHNSVGKHRDNYKKRFLSIDKVIDGYIVHLAGARNEMIREFDFSLDRITVAYHGIYEARGYEAKKRQEDGRINIIMYGYQNRYKGTDLLVQALEKLPTEFLSQTKTTIVGRTDSMVYEENIRKCEGLNIEWINQYVSEEELYNRIGESDLIVLPYREISQSGVLLLALSYRKPIVTSDLPSFKETLEGYADDWFFKSENVDSMRDLLIRFIKHEIDVERMTAIIDKLNNKYSWEESAKATVKAYEKVLRAK